MCQDAHGISVSNGVGVSIYLKGDFMGLGIQIFTLTGEMTAASKGPAALSRSACKFRLRAYRKGVYNHAVVHKKKRPYCETVLS